MEKEKAQEKEKSSQRNRRIAVLAAMLALLIAIMCLGGVTFSKYITKSGNVSKQATVAKWGYVINVNADNMFSSDYADEDADGYATAVAADKAVSVKADAAGAGATTRNMLVAPGTKGSLTFSVKGSAEVLSQIKIVIADGAEDVKLVYTKDGGASQTYNPIKWSLTKFDGTTTTTPVEDETLADVVTAIDKDKSMVVDAGTDVNYEYTLTWKWAFFVNEENDVLDTILSNIVYNAGVDAADQIAVPAGYTVESSSTTISFGLSVTVEQIQVKP